VTDEIRGSSVPVGIALWSSNPQQVRIRFATNDERIKGLKGTAYTYLRVAQQQVNQWIKNGKIPYSDIGVPHADAWWKHVSRLLVHTIRLSEPRAIDCRNVEEEADVLFEAVVAPDRDSQERTERIDSVLSSALGRRLTRQLQKGTLPGFRGRPVPVKHFKQNAGTVLIVEGVNLAAAAAEDDTDALVSRLQRIKASKVDSSENKTVVSFVGYLASPHGLNGEGALVEWIEEMAGAKTFDLLKDGGKLQDSVETIIEEMEPQSPKPRFFN
jgi:hypothetical protein